LRENHPLNNMQVKLMFFFFAFALVPLCATGAFSVKTAEELILSMAGNQIQHVAVDKAALLERWISERKADIEVVAGSSILQSPGPEPIASYLDLVRNRYKAYNEISVVSSDGIVIYSSGSDSPSGFTAEDWFTVPLTGSLYMSDIFFNPDRKESSFRISAPSPDGSGGVNGVVCATVGTYTILSVILRVSLGETGECYLVNREGTFLAHKEPARILSQNIAQSESFKNIFNTNVQRRTYIDYRGIEVIGASSKVGGTDWALVVEQDKEEAFQGAKRLKLYVSMAIAVSIGGTLLTAWLLSHYVVTPIRRLSKAADDLARGEFERVLIRTERTDEIGRLYGAFGDMARQLGDRQHRLEKEVVLKEAEIKETDVKLKQTQQAAVRSQQLASLGRLAAGVAHEIRTPLTSLKLFLDSVEGDIAISPEHTEDFRVAMDQIKRMEATITRFLDFARPQEPVFSPVDVRELAENALLVVRPRARQQATAIGTEISPALPMITGDRKQLGEVLLNLMVNALEAMQHGGELTVSAKTDTLKGEEGSLRSVRIDIEDTGPGIPEGNMAKIFDPFFTTKATGTGLGLSIVYSTIQRHGGKVKVHSRVGEGTTFSLFFSIATKQTAGEDGKNTDC